MASARDSAVAPMLEPWPFELLSSASAAEISVCTHGVAFACSDLLDDRPFDQFAGLPNDAFAFLSDHDRAKIQSRIMKCP